MNNAELVQLPHRCSMRRCFHPAVVREVWIRSDGQTHKTYWCIEHLHLAPPHARALVTHQGGPLPC